MSRFGYGLRLDVGEGEYDGEWLGLGARVRFKVRLLFHVRSVEDSS